MTDENKTTKDALKLTIEIPADECFTMCAEIFKKLNSKEQKYLVDLYFESQQKKLNEKIKNQQNRAI